jgi:hypothetical protein
LGAFAVLGVALALPAPAVSTIETHAPTKEVRPAGTRIAMLRAEILDSSLETYAKFADEIVQARVDAVRVVQRGRALPMREVDLTVLNAIKGESRSKLSVRIIGAQTPALTVLAPDAPQFQPNEEVVLFLCYDRESGSAGILGLSQGTYRVSEAPDGQKTVTGLHANKVELGAFLAHVMEEWVR